MSRDKCEGCDKPATTSDDNGVPLCKECRDAILDTPTILPWHREAAKEIAEHIESCVTLWPHQYSHAAIIARHDPHAETLRLLEEYVKALDAHEAAFDPELSECFSTAKQVEADESLTKAETAIRARLAAMKGGQ